MRSSFFVLETVFHLSTNLLSVLLRYEVLQFWLAVPRQAASSGGRAQAAHLPADAKPEGPGADLSSSGTRSSPLQTAEMLLTRSPSSPLHQDRLGREMEEVLTVTETSQGLELRVRLGGGQARPFRRASRGPPDEALSTPASSSPTEHSRARSSDPGPGKQDDSGQDVPLRAPWVVPVFDAHKLFSLVGSGPSSWKKKP